MPRNTTRTKDAIPNILDRLSRGQSLRSACLANGLDGSGSGFLQMVRKDDDLAQRYAHAIELGIDTQVGEMHDLEMRVLAGEIDSNAFRAAMDSRKWRLAKQMPEKYGDRLALSGQHSCSVTVLVPGNPAPMQIATDQALALDSIDDESCLDAAYVEVEA